MFSKAFFPGLLAATTIVATAFGGPAMAADATKMDLPAVSAFNGKIEVNGGYADLNGENGTGLFEGAAAFSMPLGQKFGLQADVTVSDALHNTSIGGAAHLFTRDPSSYLLGAYGGVADVGSANLAFIGGEGELYLGNVSVELLGGYMNVKPDGKKRQDKAFAVVDLGFYATDNLRLSLGASSIAGFESGHAGLEYMLDGSPFSITADVGAGEAGFMAAKVGATLYFGGSEPDKSLIRRHREDDPPIHFDDIFASGGTAGFIEKKNSNTTPTPPTCPPGQVLGKNGCVGIRD